MSGMNIFSGLVQGLGGSLGQMYARKREQEDQRQQWMLHLLSSSLINDNDLPQGAKRLGLKTIAKEHGIDLPDGLLNTIAPDFQDESGQEPTIAPMPQSPVQGAPQTQGKPMLGSQPSQSGQAAPKSDGQPTGDGMISDMPRNPLMDAPTLLPSAGSTSAPVTASYTQGPGTSADHVELAAHIQQVEKQLNAMPQKKIGASQNLSRSEMLANRSRRMQRDEQDRQEMFTQLHALQGMQNQREQALWQQGQEGPAMHQKLASMEQELGRPLTDQEKAQIFGIQPNAQQVERDNETADYALLSNPQIPDTAPVKMAAKARVREKELRNAQLLASTQNMLSEIQQRAKLDADPANKPGYVTKMKALSAAAAGGMFGIREQQEYAETRKAYWIEELKNGAASIPVAPTGDPEKDKMNAAIVELAAIYKSNPQTLTANAIKLAAQDVKTYQSKLADQILNHTIADPTKKVITLQWLRHRAQQARDMGGDPNKIWSYWKDKATILDDDLEPWQNPQ